ncbi:AI-2E family transporter [Pseudomonadota bacterium]
MAQAKKTIKNKAEGNGIVIKNFSGYFLIACLVITAIFLLQVFSPFLTILLLATILATAFRPLYKRIANAFKKRDGLASLTTCFLISVLIIVPLTIFILALGKQSFDTYIFIQQQVQSGSLDYLIAWEEGAIIYDALNWISQQLDGVIDLESIDLKESIIGTAQGIASFLAIQSSVILKGFGWFMIGFFIMLFSMYYLFKDGKAITDYLARISPLPEKYEHELFKKFKKISMATLYGIFLTSIVQGMLGGIGFAIAGIPNALFWGTAMAVFSLVPVVGTGIIWLPAGLILLVSGQIWQGVFLLLWGAGIVGTVDNFLRAYLIGERTKTNQLLMFLAVFGGIFTFGLVGVIFGPLILTLFFTFLSIYEMEYKEANKKK